MRRNAHWQPKDRKEDLAQDVREWVQQYDPDAKMASLEKMTVCDLTALMLALRDVNDLAYRFSCVLDHATGGYLSKTAYDKDTMYAAIDDHVHRQCDEALKEAQAEAPEQLER